ncbi:putative ectomycorrhiza-upregulated zf-mynd domain-containing protein [Hirsutella rhossiliensis]|uniref:Ectomycorrhiza-upregulated zf-mynd domain-containing protein n=1 Tax=Hirsutella rhossiliensis TaxID=111463 RepID=A0A9P8MVW2_9HYPO|nr:putative ectomycorrhiza-upregulated zf-mynd domain-containing protein [Hirsutella rhossiliensis]KAH0961364.1 putative ectomycorrhiza-upregulated zf-mynd domain-containing protein [Hirsutella rhossiliensis]
MPPIDYSKWDNIDTDSEPEASPQQAPAANPPAAHACLAADGYIRFEKRTASRGMSKLSLSDSVPSVPGLIEVPLVLDRTGTQSVNEADLDNQIATYLNIDANSGFAPPDWQSQVGTVVVARKDRKPFYPQHLEGVWMFCDHILDLFGEGDGPPRWLYSRQAFEEWWDVYVPRYDVRKVKL